jgi:hypothetical protein
MAARIRTTPTAKTNRRLKRASVCAEDRRKPKCEIPEKIGLFFVKGRFFGVWTGAEAGDKSLEFSRAPQGIRPFRKIGGGRVQFDGIRGWMVFPMTSGRALRPAGRFRICCSQIGWVMHRRQVQTVQR